MNLFTHARVLAAKSAVTALLLIISALITPSAGSCAELLVVSRPNCGYCKAWEIEVGSIYAKTAEGKVAHLRRVRIDELAMLRYDFSEPVIYTPTFVLVDRGREIGRITGYSDQAMFWGSLAALLRQSGSGAPSPTAVRRDAGQKL